MMALSRFTFPVKRDISPQHFPGKPPNQHRQQHQKQHTHHLAAAALPLGLITVGAGLRFAALRRHGGPLLYWNAIKLLLLPAIAVLATGLLGVTGLYRQAALLCRFGGTDISRNTVAGSIVRVGQAVQPIINLLRDHLLEAPLTYGDETQIQVLKEPGKSAQSKSYMWAQMTQGSGRDGRGPPLRLFTYAPSRSTKTALWTISTS